ncbi:ethylmalonyl-CoA decarboxylase isoform X5 [Vulpes vulpes]|uniref:Ethylmalonyl-CoA decarboxylase n=1 Tax=Vulpes vulpes TaxID=9627 RepID=A0A3Q7TVA6_VULVU
MHSCSLVDSVIQADESKREQEQDGEAEGEGEADSAVSRGLRLGWVPGSPPTPPPRVTAWAPEMAGNLLKTSSLSVRTKLLHQTGLSLYNTSHGFHEEDLKKKLQQFPGGSVDLQKEDSGIGILTLNNPSKMNAFSGVMMLQLLEKVIELENWTEGKGLIVRGAKNTFSSGSDLNAVKALATPEDGMTLCMFMQNTLTRLMRLPLISVALIQGRALGGGAEVTTACDFRGQESACGLAGCLWLRSVCHEAVIKMSARTQLREDCVETHSRGCWQVLTDYCWE